MIPLIDIPNHKQPERLDTSDFVTFNFNIADKVLKKEDGSSEKIKVLQFPAVTKYTYEEEFSYGYSKGLQPIQQLYTYGMVFDNNPHAVINMPQTNVFKNFSPRMRDICKQIACIDPKYYADEAVQDDLVYHRN